MPEMKLLDIIIPVYRGLDETRECILSLLPAMPDWAQLIVINDCSPEPALTQWLREQSVQLSFHLYENEQNLGFVGTVNFGMRLNPQHDVLLLNSDVEVANSDWLTRMRNAAYSHPRVASLTPFSNNATICSFPHFCQDNELFAGMNVNQLDALFAGLPLSESLVEVPTGVGFCMYIRRDCLDTVGYFDEATFGKGYGEENDWCQRAVKLGWINYHQLNVFAYHKGGVSFQEEGDPRKARALELLDSLHPTYTHDVMQFISADPAKSARMVAKLRYISALNIPVILSVTHHLGGGVAQHVSELADVYKGTAWFIRLTPGASNALVNVYLSAHPSDTNDAFIFDVEQDYEGLVAFLAELGISRVHFHHTMGLQPKVWLLPSSLGLQYDVTIHDYYMVNGNPTLTDPFGKFLGDDDEQSDQTRNSRLSISVSAAEWRDGVRPLLSRAERIIYPSCDLYHRFSRLFDTTGELVSKSVVAYHPDMPNCPPVVSRHMPGQPLRILVLGALSREKGADLLEQVALLCEPTQIEFHLLGYGYRPLRGVVNHGAYRLEQLDEKLAEINAHVIWYPALWPETYSYTLSIALVRGYPVVCPDLGAFVERTLTRDHSHLLPWNISPLDCAAFWRAYSLGADFRFFTSSKSVSSDKLLMADFYDKAYLGVSSKRSNKNINTVFDVEKWMARLLFAPSSVQLSKKERLLKLLWALRNKPLFSMLTRMIPFSVQRAIKRRLSRRPMHDIIN